MFGEPVYRSREDNAAHLPSVVVKDNPFANGHKRVDSLLLPLYLRQEWVDHRLKSRALTAMGLLVAEDARRTGTHAAADRLPAGLPRSANEPEEHGVGLWTANLRE